MPTEPTPIVAGSTEISAPGAALRVSRVDLTEVGRAMLQTQAPGLPAVAMTPELLNDYDRHSNRMHTHAALPPAASMPYSTDEPFAYFQRHPRSGTWEEVIPAAAGQPGVAAAYSAATVTRLRAEVEALRKRLQTLKTDEALKDVPGADRCYDLAWAMASVKRWTGGEPPTEEHRAGTVALWLLAREVERLQAENQALRAHLAKARDGLSNGLWDYGPGQNEHDQCQELIEELDAYLGDRP